VIVGLRPEDIEDAALVASSNGASLDVDVSLAEAMGAELIAHFPIAAKPLVGATAHAVTQGVDGGPEDSAALTLLAADSEGEALITARLSPRSAASTGKPLRVALDAERLHFFDPETEASIW
jgi:multiple sugar transport system ATP-binding protein